ncbi:MAG: hypothetical protein M5U22_02910 [Thermoleophilia bacterium]|nr:hypothetical protein [Thermoleophilia bacterium]
MVSRVKTNPVKVKVYTDEYVVSGLVHTKPGGYKERVSDIVNDPAIRFLVLTEATFRPVGDDKAPARRCSSLVVRLEDIKLLIPFEGTEADTAEKPGAGSSQNW